MAMIELLNYIAQLLMNNFALIAHWWRKGESGHFCAGRERAGRALAVKYNTESG